MTEVGSDREKEQWTITALVHRCSCLPLENERVG